MELVVHKDPQQQSEILWGHVDCGAAAAFRNGVGYGGRSLLWIG